MRSQFGIQLVPYQNAVGAKLTIIDEKSGEKLLDLDLYTKEVGELILGKYISRMGVVTDNPILIGQTRQTMDIAVPALKGVLGLTESIVAVSAKPYEVHGWRVDTAFYIRSQKKTRADGTPLVPFFRYVKE